MPFDLIIFDCDGVLVDSEAISNRVLARILSKYGATLSPTETQRLFIGQSVSAVRQTALKELDVELPSDWAAGYYQELIPALEEVQPIPGVLPVLERLVSLGVTICVASQGPPEKMNTTLGVTRLEHFFEGRVYSAKSVARPKPAPDLFLYAASECRVHPMRCAVVEDSELGVTAARSAGMTAYAYCHPNQAECMSVLGAYPIHSMDDLLPYLER